jgi:CRISPR-associated protein Cas8b1/Cst1 subtype I-B
LRLWGKKLAWIWVYEYWLNVILISKRKLLFFCNPALAKWSPQKKRRYARERYNRISEARNHIRIKLVGAEEPITKIDPELQLKTTGNPFVDTGLAVLANKAKLASVAELRLHHVLKVHGDGSSLAKDNSHLKCFTMFFTANSLLTQPAIKDEKKRIEQYKAVVNSFLENIRRETVPRRCEACGNQNSLDLGSVTNKALAKAGGKIQDRFVGRDWFPLAGSLGSDAQALPSASRSPALCALCLFAVQYAPLASVLYEGRLALFASTNEEFWYEIVSNIYEKVQRNISIGNYETLGKKGGPAALLQVLLDVFSSIERKRQLEEISNDTVVHIWQFSNAQSQDCKIHQIPNRALKFLHSLVKNGLDEEVRKIVANEKARPENTFLQCILERRDYFGLYPHRKYEGASPKLFAIYQNQLLGISPRSLKTASKISRSFWKSKSNKDAERFTTVFSPASGNLATLKGEIAKLVSKRELEPSDYFELFPLRANDQTKTENWGWNLIRYYLWNHEDVDDAFEQLTSFESPVENTKLIYYAAIIYNESIERRGTNGFKKKVMEPLQRGEIGTKWLRLQFQNLARRYPGFTFTDWATLFWNDEKGANVYEGLFRMRLIWAYSLANDQLAIKPPDLNERFDNLDGVLISSGLPNWLQTQLLTLFKWYVQNRSLRRFEDVLLRLQRSEIGLNWIKERLVKHAPDFNTQEWDDFLTDDLGMMNSEASFKVILFLDNLYRIAAQGAHEAIVG